MKFGALIRARRKTLHIQQNELAERLGVTPSAICKWESDSTYPDITLLLPLARVLGITVDEMLSFDGTLPDETEQPPLVEEGRKDSWDRVPDASASCNRGLHRPTGLMSSYPDLREETDTLPGGERQVQQGTQDLRGPDNCHIYIRTFGFFDIYVDGQAILFTHAKSKELLALLVDRRGGYLTAREAITYLWENEPVSKTTLSRCRKVAMRMNETLRKYGIEDIVKTQRGVRCLDISKVHCDLYDYLSGRSPRLYRGMYMLNYSWAEYTIAELDRERRYRQ